MAFATVDKQKAQQLRELGWSYQQIADYLKCSFQWCAINLKDVKPNEEMIKESAELYLGWK